MHPQFQNMGMMQTGMPPMVMMQMPGAAGNNANKQRITTAVIPLHKLGHKHKVDGIYFTEEVVFSAVFCRFRSPQRECGEASSQHSRIQCILPF